MRTVWVAAGAIAQHHSSVLSAYSRGCNSGVWGVEGALRAVLIATRRLVPLGYRAVAHAQRFHERLLNPRDDPTFVQGEGGEKDVGDIPAPKVFIFRNDLVCPTISAVTAFLP